jgi:hypothetical protein
MRREYAMEDQVETLSKVDLAVSASAAQSPVRFTRAGKVRLLTLSDLDRRTIAHRVVCERIAAIEAEEFDSQPTIRQHQAVVNDVLLSMLIEGVGVQHLRGETFEPKRLTELVNAVRQERRSRNG